MDEMSGIQEEREESSAEFTFDNINSKDHQKRKSSSGFISLVKETILIIVIAILLSLIIRLFVVEATIIEQHSMEPTLHSSDKVFVSKLTYRFGPIERGDIVILRSPDGSKNLVKRVVALPGETVAIVDGQTYVDGNPLQEDYVEYFDSSDYGPVTIGQGELFVLGDNRRNSMDSRTFGPISMETVASKVFYRYWPVQWVGPVS